MHFIFGEFEPPVANVLIREEFDLLEADYLGAHQHVAVRARAIAHDGRLVVVANAPWPGFLLPTTVGLRPPVAPQLFRPIARMWRALFARWVGDRFFFGNFQHAH